MVLEVSQIGQRLREWRKKQKLSQQQLASKLNVGIATLQRWELGTSTPDDRHRVMIEEILNFSNRLSTMIDASDFWEEILNELHYLAAKKSHSGEIGAPRLVDNRIRNYKGRILEASADSWSDEAQLMPPIPHTETEKANIQKGILKVRIDQALLDLFHKEKEARGLTESRLIEAILWHRYDHPDLSFRKIGQDMSSVPSPDNWEREQAAQQDSHHGGSCNRIEQGFDDKPRIVGHDPNTGEND